MLRIMICNFGAFRAASHRIVICCCTGENAVFILTAKARTLAFKQKYDRKPVWLAVVNYIFK